MKIFVTGGTGFIGSHFLKQALAIGHDLICLRRPGSRTRIPLKSEPTWVEGSLEDDLRDEIEGCDVFLHIVTGTAFEYGHSGERYNCIPVTANLEPSMSYPASKAAAAIAFYQWSIEHKLKLQYLRLFQVFGEGESQNRLWPSLKRAAISGEDVDMTEGEQLRDFTPVEDVAEQLIQALEFEKTEFGKPLFKNIGTGKPSSIRDFAEFWWKKWAAKGQLKFGSIPYRNDEVMIYVPDLSDQLTKNK